MQTHFFRVSVLRSSGRNRGGTTVEFGVRPHVDLSGDSNRDHGSVAGFSDLPPG